MMLNVPLFNRASAVDAGHQVTSPGGYEWWYFDAEDAAGQLRIVAIFFDGFVFHPGYLRKYGRYCRQPTRNQPPMAADFPCVYFVVYRDDEIVGQFMSQFPPGSLHAATDKVEVTVGPNELRTTPEGELQLTLIGTPWLLTGRGPKHLESQTLSAKIFFKPRGKNNVTERSFFNADWNRAKHSWIVANPPL